VIASGSAAIPQQTIFKEARTWQIAADAVANGGNYIYSDMGDGASSMDQMDFRTYTDPTTVGAEAETIDFVNNSAVTQVKIVSSPTRDEKIAGIQLDNGILNILSCTGGCDAAGDWIHIASQSAVATDAGSETFRPWDIAYEQLSGLFTVVFYENGQTGEAYYCQWDGTNWTPATECNNGGTRPAAFAPGAGNNIDLDAILGSTVVEWIRLVPRGDRLTSTRSDEFLLGISDAGDDLFLAHWTGSAWEDQVNPVDDMSAQNAQKFDLAWEETTGEGLAVFTQTVDAALRFSVWTAAGGWGAVDTTNGPTNPSTAAWNSWLTLASDPTSDDIALVASFATTVDADAAVWTGAAWTNSSTALTDQEGTVGKNTDAKFTRFGGRAVFLNVGDADTNVDMHCWTSAGGFTALNTGIGNPNITTGDDIEDIVLTASPNNNRMLLSARSVDTSTTVGDDIEGFTYSDSTGCADADWVNTSTATLQDTSEGTNIANSISLVHGSAYTPYSPWSLNWRFYEDVTSDDPSTGLNGATENTAPTDVAAETAIRLRINMSERGGMGQSDTRKILQYAVGSVSCTPDTVENDTDCTWTDVGDTGETSAVWRYATVAETCSACSDNGSSNTPRLTGTTTGDPEVFYIADKNGAGLGNMDHTALTVKEIDFPLFSEDVASDTTYYFRLYEPRIGGSVGQDSPVFREQDDDGANDCASATCTYPSLTTATFSSGPSLDQLLRHGAWFSSGAEQPFTF
jgi:hypothetical protein